VTTTRTWPAGQVRTRRSETLGLRHEQAAGAARRRVRSPGARAGGRMSQRVKLVRPGRSPTTMDRPSAPTTTGWEPVCWRRRQRHPGDLRRRCRRPPAAGGQQCDPEVDDDVEVVGADADSSVLPRPSRSSASSQRRGLDAPTRPGGPGRRMNRSPASGRSRLILSGLACPTHRRAGRRRDGRGATAAGGRLGL
jgi:hypothetical protein